MPWTGVGNAVRWIVRANVFSTKTGYIILTVGKPLMDQRFNLFNQVFPLTGIPGGSLFDLLQL